jgi:hypothetical protein
MLDNRKNKINNVCEAKASWRSPKLLRIKISRTMSGSPGIVDFPNGDTPIIITT